MKRLILITLVAVFVAVMSSGYLFARNDKVTICHKPGTPAEKTLSVSPRAEQAHLRHGDTSGECVGETSVPEDVCAGESGAAFGLCNAYCEAMDCDSDAQQASDKACDKVFSLFMNITGNEPPCETVVCMPPDPCDGGGD